MEIKNQVIIVDQASATLRKIAKTADLVTKSFKKLSEQISTLNRLRVSDQMERSLIRQNRLLSQQLAIITRIGQINRLGSGNRIRFAPINLTSAIAEKIRPIDLNGRIRIRGGNGPIPPNPGPGPGPGPSGGSGGGVGALGRFFFLTEAFKTVGQAVLGFGEKIGKAAFAASEFADKQIKDQYKLGMLVPDPDKFQQKLYESAIRSRSSLSDVNDAAIQMAMGAPTAFKTPGSNLVNVEQAMKVSETFTKMAKLSGATTSESQNALLQFRQALGSGVLQGDELRSIKEQMPMISNYLVDYLNKTKQFGTVGVGDLKKLGSEGKLTSDIMIGAMEDASKSIDEQFKNLPMSVSEAMTQIGTIFQGSMIPISQQFGKIFNGKFFEPFFRSATSGFEILGKKISEAMSVLSSTNGGSFIQWMQEAFNSLSSVVGDVAIKMAGWAQVIIENWTPVGAIFEAIGGVFQILGSIVGGVVDIFLGFVQGLNETAGASLSCSDGVAMMRDIIASVVEPLVTVAQWIGNLIGWIYNLLNASGAVQTFGSIVQGVMSGIASAIDWVIGKVQALIGVIGSAVSAAQSAVSSISSAISSIHMPSFLGGGSVGGSGGGVISKIGRVAKSGLKTAASWVLPGGGLLSWGKKTSKSNPLKVHKAPAQKKAQPANPLQNIKIWNNAQPKVPSFGGGGGGGAGGGGGHRGRGGGGGRHRGGGGGGHRGRGATKSSPMYVQNVKPIQLDEKYLDIMFGTAKLKWNNNFASKGDQPITVNVTGNNTFNNGEDSKTFANKIGEAVKKQMRGNTSLAY